MYEHTETEGVCSPEYQLKAKMTKFGTYARKYILRETRGTKFARPEKAASFSFIGSDQQHKRQTVMRIAARQIKLFSAKKTQLD